MTDDPGVMGNLPRSRPGRRSAKRASDGKSAGKGGKATPARATAKKTTAASAKSRAAAPKSAAPPRAPHPPVKPSPRGPDPVGDAVRVAAKLAGAGIGIAAGVLKRLPRP
jgi:hypothetical protein